MVALMSMSNAAAQSQTITICDGTDENKYVPFYFYYLDNGAMISAFKEQIDIYLAMDLGEEMEQAMNNTYEILSQLTASDITIQYFTSNVFIASLLAPITSLFVFKK